jgi:hypothetical protein
VGAPVRDRGHHRRSLSLFPLSHGGMCWRDLLTSDKLIDSVLALAMTREDASHLLHDLGHIQGRLDRSTPWSLRLLAVRERYYPGAEGTWLAQIHITPGTVVTLSPSSPARTRARQPSHLGAHAHPSFSLGSGPVAASIGASVRGSRPAGVGDIGTSMLASAG